MSKRILPPVYEPKEVEAKWYRFWEEGKFFRGEVDPSRRPFCIVMPPPNVTGELHMGHALDNTLQDVLIRWRRMQGYATLWVPGTDHAGIATQARVEAELAKEGLTRHDLGREKFLERVWQWKEKYGNTITMQLRRLGASCDWDRERFTMDEGCSRAVKEVFIRLYEEGLIYRGDYIVNWCPRCQTVISDIEVEHKETPGKLYYIRYPLAEGGFITIATTRPETMLGDTAVAVNPEDPRYRELIGKKAILPLVGRELPIIADEYVDMEFGTGALKVTPAHDPHDFEIGQRHHLPAVQVIGFDARMTEEAGERYRGLDRWEARRRVVEDLRAQGLLEKEEDIVHAVGHCYRCGEVVEPMISKQWFVRMKPLAEPAVAAVEEGRIRFIPERFTKIYLNWVKNIKDWCISRQLWWGHRIPVWHCADCGRSTAARNGLDRCPHCGSSRVEQDPDVLDTWFSSALWPFSTLGWPEVTPELKFFYPTSVLVTGRDIIFFWVARMIFMGLKFMGDVPFREVFIHGLVLDALGRKMSKSLGNGVDPLEVIESHGADSLRFMLVTGSTPGNDLRFHFERLDGARNFINKLWNASRFVLMNLDEEEALPQLDEVRLELVDRWIISRLQDVVERVTAYLEEYELGEAARLLYEFMWDEFCDWYIEMAKLRLYGADPEARRTAQVVLKSVLGTCLKLLHPFIPFVTEEIWHRLEPGSAPLIVQSWPAVEEKRKDAAAEAAVGMLQEVVRAVRHLRAEMRVPPGKRATVILVTREVDKMRLLEEHRKIVESLVAGELVLKEILLEKPVNAAHAVAAGIEIYLPLEGLIDVEKERARLHKELKELEEELSRVRRKLDNPSFLAKAPAEVVAKERAKEEELEKNRLSLEKLLSFLEGV
ncbi:valine--tRNA ligase [Ammonifex thiophilus]|uniref:Valine--tRNA ligase n=1 Tax=Ammonifex thiophilus TaxID=444093 RepID=A0A3D8P656_9THEO|nr:valine--tRNA ligase [Ammonifex thiophilus]RDV84813.1 valine--tRNA ligase [Ammonifex thiophilus]